MNRVIEIKFVYCSINKNDENEINRNTSLGDCDYIRWDNGSDFI